MKEYEEKSLEELRMEDYMLHRGPGFIQPGDSFGSTTQKHTSLLGTPASQSQSTSLFGKQPASNTAVGFNTTSVSTFEQTKTQPQTGLFSKLANAFGKSIYRTYNEIINENYI